MNLFAIARFLVYVIFGFGLPSAAVYLGVFLPHSRSVLLCPSDLHGLPLCIESAGYPMLLLIFVSCVTCFLTLEELNVGCPKSRRRAEYEADQIGLALMAQACYHPHACSTMVSEA